MNAVLYERSFVDLLFGNCDEFRWIFSLFSCCVYRPCNSLVVCIISDNPSRLLVTYTKAPWHTTRSAIYRVIQNDCRGFNNMPPHSPDPTSCDFFLWGCVKDQIYVHSLPASIPELKVRIRTAIQTITADMLQTVGTNLIIVLMFVESQRVHI